MVELELSRLFLTFDTEDFISHNSIPIMKKILESLKKHNLRAIFFLTGHMAEKMRNFPEVVRLLEDHEIGYHSSSHSVHPTIFEFTDVENYEQARENSLLRETSHINPLTGEIKGKGGILALREVFPNKRIDAFRAPAHCWSPPHMEALKELGIKYDFSTNLCGQPIHYKGITYYPYPIIGHWHGRPSEYELLSNAILRHKLSVLTIHPHLFVTLKEWDAIYYASNPAKIIKPLLRSREETAFLLNRFELLLRLVSDLQKIRALGITPNLEKAKRNLIPEEVAVEECYRISIRWAIMQNYRPKFLYRHFLRFFGRNNESMH